VESVGESPRPAVLRFRGWIPTVSGRLSFSVLGRTLYPSRAIYANAADPESRFLAAYQAHNISDAIIPSYFIGLNGRFVFLIIASTKELADNSQFVLAGECFIFADVDVWNQAVLHEVSAYMQALRLYRHTTHQKLTDYATHSHERLIDVCRSHASFGAEISISRRGTAELSIRIPNAVSSTAPRLPDNQQRRDNIIHSLAAQIYFFVKNILHHHQHHDPATDTILDLYPITDEDDASWRLNTLYSMYRTVTEYKRNPHSSSFNDCIGIIAYANTFASLCHEELDDETYKKLPQYYGANTAESIKSTQARIERELLVRRRRQDTIRNTLLAILSVVLSFAGLMRLTSVVVDVQPDPILITLVKWALTNAVITVLGFVLFIGAMSAFSRARYIDQLPKKLVAVLRLLQPFQRKFVVGMLMFVSISLALAAILVAL
jgi:hypothetical protein